jgi:hypothetical protein
VQARNRVSSSMQQLLLQVHAVLCCCWCVFLVQYMIVLPDHSQVVPTCSRLLSSHAECCWFLFPTDCAPMKSGVLAAAGLVGMKEVVHYCHCCGLGSHSEADRLEARGTCCQKSHVSCTRFTALQRSYRALAKRFSKIYYEV